MGLSSPLPPYTILFITAKVILLKHKSKHSIPFLKIFCWQVQTLLWDSESYRSDFTLYPLPYIPLNLYSPLQCLFSFHCSHHLESTPTCFVATYWNFTHYIQRAVVVTFPPDCRASAITKVNIMPATTWEQCRQGRKSRKKKNGEVWNLISCTYLSSDTYHWVISFNQIMWVVLNSIFWNNMWSRMRTLGRWWPRCTECHTET